MTPEGSVTRWIEQLKTGDPLAAQKLWERYFQRLVGLARKKLLDAPRQAADEEDVALRSRFKNQAAWAKGWNSSPGCRPKCRRRAQMTQAANCCMPRKWASVRS